MGGSSHRRSASPEYELDAFEFFSVILGTSVSATRQVYKTRDLPFTHLIMISVVCYITPCPKLQRLPDTFMNMLGEDPPHNVKFRQAGGGVRRLWDVELVIEEGHMYLCRGWEKFYSAYDLRTGYFLLFRYDDDATMLIVKVFNTTMCRMRYADDDDASTFCLFLFLYIWLCLTSIVNGHCCIWTGNGSSSSDTGYSQSSSDSGFSESSSDSGSSKDSKKDDPDWSGGEEEQSGDEELQDDDGHQAEDDLALVVADQGQEMVVADHGQEMEVAEDDLAMVVPVLPEGGLAMVVVPDNDHAPVVAPAIPQLGDMTTPIVVEDYIPLPPPPRRSWRIRLRKEKEKNNEN